MGGEKKRKNGILIPLELACFKSIPQFSEEAEFSCVTIKIKKGALFCSLTDQLAVVKSQIPQNAKARV